MTRLSILSARITNANVQIIVVVDRESYDALRSSRHRVREVCDEIIPIDTPAGEPAFRNRWVKTQLPMFVPGGALFIDSDTLVRKKVDLGVFHDADFAAVPNHNAASIDDQIWIDDRKVMEGMNWQLSSPAYVNGGLWYFGGADRVNRLFVDWHHRWKESYERFGRWRDQPALNAALSEANLRFAILDRSYNEQVEMASFQHTASAIIWHFYSSMEMSKHGYRRLLERCREQSNRRTTSIVKRFIFKKAPWMNQDFVAAFIDRIYYPTEVGDAAKLWLDENRTQSLRLLRHRIRHRMLNFRRSR
jgi:hypothetical protein